MCSRPLVPLLKSVKAAYGYAGRTECAELQARGGRHLDHDHPAKRAARLYKLQRSCTPNLLLVRKR